VGRFLRHSVYKIFLLLNTYHTILNVVIANCWVMPTVMIHVVRSHDSLLAFVSPLDKWIWWSVISLGGLCPFEVLGFHLPQCGQGRGLPLYQVASWFIQPFGHNRHGRKLGVLCPLFEGSRVSIYHSVAGAETYLHAKFHLDSSNCLATILQAHRTDRQTGQRSDSMGQTVLQTVAQKSLYLSKCVTDHHKICMVTQFDRFDLSHS